MTVWGFLAVCLSDFVIYCSRKRWAKMKSSVRKQIKRVYGTNLAMVFDVYVGL